MKTAVLINDTSTKFHIGCRIVVGQIFNLAEQFGIRFRATCSVHVDWRQNDQILDAIRQADIVIVNGEGTLHHATPQALALAEVAPYCERLGKPAVLINSVYEENNREIAEHCRRFSLRFLREPSSALHAQEAGVPCSIVPDLTLSSSLFGTTPARRDSGIIVTDNANRDVGRPMLEYSLAKRNVRYLRLDVCDIDYCFAQPHLQPALRISAGVLEPPKGQSTLKTLERSIFRSKMRARMRMLQQLNHPLTSPEILERISLARGIIAGRFHAACLAMVAGTPFVAMPSNTGKTKGMLDAAGLGHLYESDPKETFSRLAAWTDDDRERAQSYVRHARAAAHDMFGQIAALASA